MRRTHARLAAVATAFVAAVVAGYALRPAPNTAVLAARKPAVQVQTVVVRRTIHIVKHEHPPVAAGPGGLGGSFSAGGTAPRTHTSGSHAAGAGAVAVRTRVSGSHSIGAPSGAAVTTRTSSGAGGSHGSSGPVTTRTSAGHAGSGGTVSTRTSGSHGTDGGDGGNGSGGDN
jgi:hypothetical protein